MRCFTQIFSPVCCQVHQHWAISSRVLLALREIRTKVLGDLLMKTVHVSGAITVPPLAPLIKSFESIGCVGASDRIVLVVSPTLCIAYLRDWYTQCMGAPRPLWNGNHYMVGIVVSRECSFMRDPIQLDSIRSSNPGAAYLCACMAAGCE